MKDNEALKWLKDMLKCFDLPQEQYQTALEMAIKALEQGPILDKIRAEIADLDDADYDYEGYYKAVTDVLQVIDKYRQEG